MTFERRVAPFRRLIIVHSSQLAVLTAYGSHFTAHSSQLIAKNHFPDRACDNLNAWRRTASETFLFLDSD